MSKPTTTHVDIHEEGHGSSVFEKETTFDLIPDPDACISDEEMKDLVSLQSSSGDYRS
jgi:hypothetical protein